MPYFLGIFAIFSPQPQLLKRRLLCLNIRASQRRRLLDVAQSERRRHLLSSAQLIDLELHPFDTKPLRRIKHGVVSLPAIGIHRLSNKRIFKLSTRRPVVVECMALPAMRLSIVDVYAY